MTHAADLATTTPLGTVKNKGNTAVLALEWPVKASTAVVKGKLVYYSTGAVTVPADGTIFAPAIYFCEDDGDNSSGSLGDKLVTVYKKNAIVVGKAQGTITVGKECQASETTAGSFMEWASPAAATATIANTTTSNEINAVRDADKKRLAVYVGHVGEGIESGTVPTNAADGDTNCVFMMY